MIPDVGIGSNFTTDAADQFRSEMVSAGLIPPDHIEPGQLHRFPGVDKKNGNRAGWCKLFYDRQGGVYGDWSSGIRETWQAARDKPYTPTERKAFRAQCAKAFKEREAEEAEIHAKAATQAEVILAAANGDPPQHPYALVKRVPLGTRVKRGAWPQRDWNDALLVPLYDETGKLCTLQAINTDGEKDFLKGGRKARCGYFYGRIRGAERVLIGEGPATAGAVHCVTSLPSVAAMDCGNLLPVAQIVRKLAPKAEIFFLADNDIRPDGTVNAGVEAANKAAQAVSGIVVIPKMDGRNCDFWDLWNEHGAVAVQIALKKAGCRILSTYTSRDLMKKKFPAVKWAVPGIIPEGVTLLAGKPKVGKSWLCINLCVAVTGGGSAFGKIECEPGAVLYLALEDTERRMQSRLKASGKNSGTDGLHFAHEWRRVDQGGASDLDQWLTVHPGTRLVIIDTLAKIRPKIDKSGKSAYSIDYESLEPLLPIAAKHRVSILIVCHTRKMESDDPLEMVSGTLGLTGGVDGVIVMLKKRDDPRCVLFVTGRDIENEMSHVMRFNPQSKIWELTNESPEAVNLSAMQNEVLDCIRKLPSPSAADIQKSIAVTMQNKGLDLPKLSTVKTHIERLREKGLIFHNGKGYIATAQSQNAESNIN